MIDIDSLFAKAIQLAENGRGRTSPNPFVGALIIKNNEIIGEGYTQPWGYDHAEVQALKKAGSNAENATMIVTLEPCCSYGKTPPCTTAIIDANIKKVYIGIADPNPKVNGKGIEILKNAGIEVHTGFQQDVIKKQLEYYLIWITKKRPFIFLKSAMTLDGYIAGSDGSSKWITGEQSRFKVHQLRQEADAIITGIGTVLADDPMMNCRLDNPIKQPCRIVMDKNLRIPLNSKIVSSTQNQRTVVFCENCNSRKKTELIKSGVEVKTLEQLNPNVILQFLRNENLYSAMLEAGNRLNSAFNQSGLIDKYYLFISPSIIGNGLKVFSHEENININDKKLLRYDSVDKFGNDLLITAYPVP